MNSPGKAHADDVDAFVAFDAGVTVSQMLDAVYRRNALARRHHAHVMALLEFMRH